MQWINVQKTIQRNLLYKTRKFSHIFFDVCVSPLICCYVSNSFQHVASVCYFSTSLSLFLNFKLSFKKWDFWGFRLFEYTWIHICAKHRKLWQIYEIIAKNAKKREHSPLKNLAFANLIKMKIWQMSLVSGLGLEMSQIRWKLEIVLLWFLWSQIWLRSVNLVCFVSWIEYIHLVFLYVSSVGINPGFPCWLACTLGTLTLLQHVDILRFWFW